MITAHGDPQRVVACDGAGQAFLRHHTAAQSELHRARPCCDRRREQRVHVAVADSEGITDNEFVRLSVGRGPGVVCDRSRRRQSPAASGAGDGSSCIQGSGVRISADGRCVVAR